MTLPQCFHQKYNIHHHDNYLLNPLYFNHEYIINALNAVPSNKKRRTPKTDKRKNPKHQLIGH